MTIRNLQHVQRAAEMDIDKQHLHEKKNSFMLKFSCAYSITALLVDRYAEISVVLGPASSPKPGQARPKPWLGPDLGPGLGYQKPKPGLQAHGFELKNNRI